MLRVYVYAYDGRRRAAARHAAAEARCGVTDGNPNAEDGNQQVAANGSAETVDLAQARRTRDGAQ